MGNDVPMAMVECRFCCGEVPAHARKCKHCGEWLKNAPAEADRSRGSPSRPPRDDARVTCQHCHKKMIPRIITGPPVVRPSHGWTPVPKKSICPFCGGLHMKFPMSSGERVGLFVVGTIIFVVAIVLLGR